MLLPSLSRGPSERSTKYHSAGPAGVHAVLAAAGGGRRHAGGRHTQPHLRGAAPGQPVASAMIVQDFDLFFPVASCEMFYTVLHNSNLI